MACIFHNKPCVFFRVETHGKNQQGRCGFRDTFLSRRSVSGARFAETSFGRAGSQPDHATRYRRGGLMPSNARISSVPRMGMHELMGAHSETQSHGAKLHKQKSPSCSTRDGEQTIRLIICQRLNASLSSFIDSSLMPSGSKPMDFAS